MKPHEWRWAIRDAPIDRASKSVGHALASRMNGSGECWPSKQQLADDTGYSVRWVDVAVNRLEQAGYIGVRRGGGRHHSNVYSLQTPQQLRGIEDVNPAVSDKKPRSERYVNPAATAGEVVKKKKEVRQPPLTAYAAASAVTVDTAMLALARGWLEVHQ